MPLLRRYCTSLGHSLSVLPWVKTKFPAPSLSCIMFFAITDCIDDEPTGPCSIQQTHKMSAPDVDTIAVLGVHEPADMRHPIVLFISAGHDAFILGGVGVEEVISNLGANNLHLLVREFDEVLYGIKLGRRRTSRNAKRSSQQHGQWGVLFPSLHRPVFSVRGPVCITLIDGSGCITAEKTALLALVT